MPVVLLLFSLLTNSVMAVDFPDGWRLPTNNELPSTNKENVKIEADFNGDGKPDFAYLLKSTKFIGEGLLVWLSIHDGYQWKHLDRVEWSKEFADAPLVMRIELAPIAKYKTACASGYWECAPDEPGIFELQQPGIQLTRFDNAVALWYWDRKTGAFKQHWLGD